MAHLQCVDGITQQLLLGQLKGKVFVKVVINFRLIKTYALVPQSNRMGVLLHGQSFTVIIWLRGVRRWRFRYRYALVKSRHKEIITDITPRAKCARARTTTTTASTYEPWEMWRQVGQKKVLGSLWHVIHTRWSKLPCKWKMWFIFVEI